MSTSELNLIKHCIKLLEENNNYTNKTAEVIELLKTFDE